VIYCFQALLGHKKQHALLEAGSGRRSRLSSPEADFSEAPGGAEASTVGFYRAELHKRALQSERTMAYLAPIKHVELWFDRFDNLRFACFAYLETESFCLSTGLARWDRSFICQQCGAINPLGI